MCMPECACALFRCIWQSLPGKAYKSSPATLQNLPVSAIAAPARSELRQRRSLERVGCLSWRVQLATSVAPCRASRRSAVGDAQVAADHRAGLVDQTRIAQQFGGEQRRAMRDRLDRRYQHEGRHVGILDRELWLTRGQK